MARAPAARDLALEQIHPQIRHGEMGRILAARAAGAADERLHAGQQFGEREGFRQVIVAAALQAEHAVVEGGAGAEDQHRRGDFLLAQEPQQGQAVELGQVEVEHRGVVRDGFRQVQPRLAVAGVIDGKAVLLQPVDDERGDLGIIFDDEHTHG